MQPKNGELMVEKATEKSESAQAKVRAPLPKPPGYRGGGTDLNAVLAAEPDDAETKLLKVAAAKPGFEKKPDPESPEAVDPLTEWEQSLPARPAFPDLHAYAAYRRALLYKPRLGGNIGGAAAINASSIEAILRELEALADWMGSGQPGAAARLSAEDAEFWISAKGRGMQIPEDVERALEAL